MASGDGIPAAAGRYEIKRKKMIGSGYRVYKKWDLDLLRCDGSSILKPVNKGFREWNGQSTH